ncbi:hypothetical protein KZO25_19260 [Halomonas sp. ANAO-440]|nr:hypothetical protein [Halomonas sp. ANAO-440]MBZ0332452.1 hypothetical protein [Halomonas sp. ANAO-440]
MKTMNLKASSFVQIKSTSLDAEALDFWGERARIQLSYMDAISAYLD